MSLLYGAVIHVSSASQPIPYKVFGDGGEKIVWLFCEPPTNTLTSITNSIEDIFQKILPALCQAVQNDFSGFLQAKTRLEIDAFLLNALSAATRGFPMFSDLVLIKDLGGLLQSLSTILKDCESLVNALRTGSAYQHIPSEQSMLNDKRPYVTMLPVNGQPDDGDWPRYTVERWESDYAQYGAKV